ncbi:MAG TPA: hydroxyquinol 1,2-dioxygenase, partial [Acidimicrobiia bacterium]|nr:hydroxyquinol 1,2-dioxygenase [Acidimicrobiia bacterium]
KEGSIRVEVEPAGSPMGYVLARRGHMTLLPAQVAYRFSAERPGVILLQTIQGDDTIERWAEICQQMA